MKKYEEAAHPSNVRLKAARAEHPEHKPELQCAEAAAQRQLPVLSESVSYIRIMSWLMSTVTRLRHK